jgi:hypothetical protein
VPKPVPRIDEPKPVHFRDSDMKRPLMPRLREAIWSFHVLTQRSMTGKTD